MKRHIALGVIVLALLATVFYFVGRPDKEAQKEAKAQQQMIADQIVPVTFVSPRTSALKSTLDVSGPLKTLDDVQLGAKIPGRLTMVTVREGSRVRAGQVVARVETRNLMQQINQAQGALQAAMSVKQQAEIQANISPQQSLATIRQAQAGLDASKARLSLVRKGARSQEKDQAKERVNESKARLDKAKSDLDRAKRLFAGDAIPRADVEAAQMQYDSALSNYRSALEGYDLVVEGARPEEISQAEDAVRQAEEQLRLARTNTITDHVKRQQVQQAEAQIRQARASLSLAQMQLADAAVVSPVSGYVSGKPAQVGQVVNVGSPIATVVGLSGVYFEGQIPETEIANVSVGQQASVRMDALPNRVFTGRIVAIDPRADNLGRQFAARIAMNDGGVLRPGMFGKATLTLITIPNAVLVPRDAVLKQNGTAFVFVANGQVAKKLAVKLGRVQKDWIQVIGLAPSEKVIVKGKDALTDGGKIREDDSELKEARL
ncbi:MAG: efflux RND transporter periplasmic adaptor subunit [Fimbriimonadales bacterium]